MNDQDIAIVTPSFSRDLALCRTLNRSVLEFLPANVRHYILVDRRDLALFRSLSGARTDVLVKEDIMPSGIVQMPRFNRWFSRGTILPISGWLVQQIAKIAIASFLSEATLLMVDSDAVFVRDVDPRIFGHDGEARLYTQRGGITADMVDHVAWYRNACRLLGLASEPLPVADYIGQVISWKREMVLQMCARVEAVTGRPWYDAIARARKFSEYLLYGVFVERVAGTAGNVWIDERSRCNSHWATSTMTETEVPAFVASLRPDDIALMINTHSGTSQQTRAAAITLATHGRLAS